MRVQRYTTCNRLNSFSKTKEKPEKLSPTEKAAEYNSLRRFEPIDTTLEPGPPELLNVIRCNCKLSTKTPCGKGNCSYRKNGLSCVAACGHCHGNNCANVVQFEDVDDEDECFERNAFELFEFL